MRPRYYLWYAFGVFTLVTAGDGVVSLIAGPSRTSTIFSAPLYLLLGFFFSLALWVQMACIAKFNRPWFKVKDSFVTAFVAGIITAALLMVIAYPMARLNIPYPIPQLVILLLPVPSLWLGSAIVSKFSKTSQK